MVYFLSGLFILILAYLGGNIINLRGADIYLIAAGFILLILGATQLILARRS